MAGKKEYVVSKNLKHNGKPYKKGSVYKGDDAEDLYEVGHLETEGSELAKKAQAQAKKDDEAAAAKEKAVKKAKAEKARARKK